MTRVNLMDFLPANFQLPVPFRSRITVTGQDRTGQDRTGLQDRHTDGQTDTQRPSMSYASTLWGGGIIMTAS